MSELNLRQTVRDILSTSSLADPGEIADKVYANLTADEYGPALQQTLRLFVRVVIDQSRSASLNPPTAPTPVPNQRPAAKSSRSWKQEGIRAEWQRFLAAREFVGTGWKVLRDCTRQEVLFLAEDRRGKAAELAAKADLYQRLADEMKRRRAKTVSDLPGPVIAAAIGVAA